MKTYKSNILYDPLVGNFLSWFVAFLIMSPYVNGWVTTPWLLLVGFFIGPIWTIWLHAYRQAIKIEIRNEEINHAVSFVVRAIVASVIAYLSHLLIVCPCVDAIIPAIACALYLGSIFWLLFDFMINYHRGKPLLYIDQGTIAAKSDNFFSNKK